jgi:PST family polysaccharide transporter
VKQEQGKTDNSYKEIFKSTTLVGGSQVLNILIGIIRTKAIALFLGLDGVGLMGMYQSIISVLGNVFGLGIGNSGVRQVAEKVAVGDTTRIARTVKILTGLSWVLGLIGMFLTIVLSSRLSVWTFGDESHSAAIVLLSGTLLFSTVTTAYSAVLQGMRRISDIAKITVIGAFLGTVFSLPIIYVWHQKAIVPALVVIAFMAMVPVFFFYKKLKFESVALTLTDIIHDARGLLSLGFVFMYTGVLYTLVTYLVRVLVIRRLGIESVGLYQAVITLSSLYINIILNAMGMDYYPRLTAVATDNTTVNRLVNEQTLIGMLLAAPGILATLTFTPFVISVFYSTEFIPAYDVLRWQVLGVFLRVISWPISYVLLAKGKGIAFFVTETIWNVLYLITSWLGLKMFGLVGVGIAFFVMYGFYLIMIYLVVNRMTRFCWDSSNIRIGLGVLACIAIVFVSFYILPGKMSSGLNIVLMAIVSALCLKKVYSLVGVKWLNQWFRK